MPDILTGAAAPRARLRGIYALVDPAQIELEPFVDDLLGGGIRLFQVRAKRGIERARLARLVERVRTAGGLTIVNDDIALAELADGVHLGQEDAAEHDLAAVRQRLGERIIGLSCGTPAQARLADPALIDYIGVGPLFATQSKPDAGLPIGINGARAVVDACGLPAAAIGGIDLQRIARARETGAAMAAIISALSSAPDVRGMARAFVTAWSQ